MATQRISTAETDSAGMFEFQPSAVEGSLQLTVRHIGFAPRVLEVAVTDTALMLRMEDAPIILPTVIAAGRRGRLCPNREDPRARALWEAMRNRYWQEPVGYPPVFGLAQFEVDTVPRENIGAEDMGRTVTGWVEHVRQRESLIPAAGYAFRSAGSVTDRTTFWWYSSLDNGTSQHFTQPLFGQLHKFAFAAGVPGQLVVSFCPRERLGEKGQIEGTLTLRGDTTLARAGWTFRTREPSENAGGEATYLPPDPGMRRLLLGEATLFWRQLPNKQYYVERERYAGWRFMDGSFRPVDAAAEADEQGAGGTP